MTGEQIDKLLASLRAKMMASRNRLLVTVENYPDTRFDAIFPKIDTGDFCVTIKTEGAPEARGCQETLPDKYLALAVKYAELADKYCAAVGNGSDR